MIIASMFIIPNSIIAALFACTIYYDVLRLRLRQFLLSCWLLFSQFVLVMLFPYFQNHDSYYFFAIAFILTVIAITAIVATIMTIRTTTTMPIMTIIRFSC